MQVFYHRSIGTDTQLKDKQAWASLQVQQKHTWVDMKCPYSGENKSFSFRDKYVNTKAADAPPGYQQPWYYDNDINNDDNDNNDNDNDDDNDDSVNNNSTNNDNHNNNNNCNPYCRLPMHTEKYMSHRQMHSMYNDFNSLRPSDAILRRRTGSTLAQVMACRLTAPSHYLNQCWLIISKVL